MGRSNPNEYAENPAQKFFDWQGGDGKLVYYDREAKENVEVKRPFRFLVLEEVATVGGGYDDGDNFVGYWSNAIRPRDAKRSKFTVRSSVNGKKRIEMTGTWAEVKAHLTGAKYIKGLYIGYFDANDELVIGYLKIRGAAMGAWMEFCKTHKNIYEGAFTITNDVTKKKKGTNNYLEPVFTHTANIKEETNQAALALDADILQPYLAEYFAQEGQAETSDRDENYTGSASEAYDDRPMDDPSDFEVPEATGSDDIPF